MVDSLATVKET